MNKRVLTFAFLALIGSAAFGKIAVFAEGRTLKIESYAAIEDSMQLTLPSGGTLVVPLTRIDRIIDDEYILPAEEVEAAESAFPRRSWGFTESSQPLYASKFNPLILEASRKFDVDAALVSAIIKVESDYNPRIVSHKGARGLMQLMPATARRFGVSDSFDPKMNIYGGTRYLRWLLNHFEGNIDYVVAAYNAGEGNVAKYDGIPPFRETVRYLEKVSRHFPRAESSVATIAR